MTPSSPLTHDAQDAHVYVAGLEKPFMTRPDEAGVLLQMLQGDGPKRPFIDLSPYGRDDLARYYVRTSEIVAIEFI